MSEKANAVKPAGPAAKAVAKGGGGGVVALAILPNSMKLENVINPNRQNDQNQDAFRVLDASGERLVASGGAILSGDTIVAEAQASGLVQALNEDGIVDIVAFEGDDPVTVEIDWTEVGQVDEYYNGSGYTYDITVDTGTNPDVISIEG